MNLILILVLIIPLFQEYESTNFTLNHEEEIPDFFDLLMDLENVLAEIEGKISIIGIKIVSDWMETFKDVFLYQSQSLQKYSEIAVKTREKWKILHKEATAKGENTGKCFLEHGLQWVLKNIKYLEKHINCWEAPNNIIKELRNNIEMVLKRYVTVNEIVEIFEQCRDRKCTNDVRIGANEIMMEKYNKVQKLYQNANNNSKKLVPNLIEYFRNINNDLESLFTVIPDLEICIRMRLNSKIEKKSINFEKIISEMVKAISNAFYNEMDKILIFGGKMIENFEYSGISISIDNLHKRIIKMMDDFKKVGNSIEKCAENIDIERLKLLVLYTKKSVDFCGEKLTYRTINLSLEAINFFRESIKEINNLEEEFATCIEEKCRVETEWKAYSVEIQQKNKILRHSGQVIDKLTDNNLNYEECVNYTPNFNDEENKVIDDFRKCIIDGIDGRLFETLEKVIGIVLQNYYDASDDNLLTLPREIERFYSIINEFVNTHKKQNKKISQIGSSQLTILKENFKNIATFTEFCFNSYEEKMTLLLEETEKDYEDSLEELTKILIMLKEDFEILLNEENGNLYEFVREYHACTTSKCRIKVLKKGRYGEISEVIENIFDQNLEFEVKAQKIMDYLKTCLKQSYR